MIHTLSRRRFLLRGLAVSCSALVLGGCGGADASATSEADADAEAIRKTGPVTPVPTPTPATFSWRRLPVGAGGYVTGIDIAPDGTKVCRCDSSGAYIWRGDRWQPLLTMKSMPEGHWGGDIGAPGVYDIAVAPSNSATIYVCVNGRVYRSDNGGTNFTLTSLPQIAASFNDNYKFYGRKMVVDPSDRLTLFVGSQVGPAWVTRDGGLTWSNLSPPAPANSSGVRLAVSGEALYLHTCGVGVFLSVDKGVTFRPLGGPAQARHIAAGAGILWITDSAGNLQRYKNGQWTIAITGGDQKTIAIARDGRIAVGGFGGGTRWSTDGETWSAPQFQPMPRKANDIPWLAWTNEAYMSSGGAAFDTDGSYWYAEGIGIWRAILPKSGDFEWESRSIGIEQLTSTGFLVPPSGKPLYLAWDRPVFKIDDLTQFPTQHGPNAKSSIVCGWSADFAPENPRVVVLLANWTGVEQSSISYDGGGSWSQLPTMPSEISAGGKVGGSIAVASQTNFVVCPSNNGRPYFTKNGGQTWQPCGIPSMPGTGETGFGSAYYFHRFILTADKSASGTFYLYNNKLGLLRSRDGGESFSLIFAGQITDWTQYHAKLAAVPGKAGHLLFSAGQQDGPAPAWMPLTRSIDGGATWVGFKDTQEVHTFGFGAPAAGRDYPAIYIVGYVKGIWGVYRSDDEGVSWVALGSYPLDIGDSVVGISGDPNIFGRVYVAFGGSGAAYGGYS